MSQTIKVIETQYKGYRFRSRLEARWAVFFDALDIEWVYEPEGYDLGGAGWYLPDFWLPTFNNGMFVEVKPPGGDFSKAKALSELSVKNMWLAEGNPNVVFYACGRVEDGSGEYLSPVLPEDEWYISWEGAAPLLVTNWGNDRMHWDFGNGECPIGEGVPDDFFGYKNIRKAVDSARSARFEHGETPQ